MLCETLALPAEGGLRLEVWMLLPNARYVRRRHPQPQNIAEMCSREE